MPSRYHISPILLGSEVPPNTPPEEAPGNRPAVAELAGVSWTGLLPTDQQGNPDYLFAFCHVSHDDLSKVQAVSNSFTFPDYPLDGRMDGMEAATRAAMVQSVGAYNLDGNGLTLNAASTDSQSYGEYITQIATQFEAAFDINKFFAREGI